jgi:hypothetical protein
MSSNSHPRTRCSAGRRAGSWDAGARPAAAACVKGICNVGTTRDTRTCSGSSDLPIRGGRGNNRTSTAGFWVAATDLRAVADLAEAGGWEAEYPRDVWRMRRLGYDGDRTLRFAAIPQPWLRDLTKRWVRWRLSTGLCRATGGGRPVVVITRFAGFLADIGVERIDQIDRSVLKRYLADLRGDSVGTQRRSAHLGLLNRIFAAIRQHRWDTALPADAMFCTEDHPKRAERLPRALAEHVMAQLEHPDNLARFDDPALQNPSENPSDLRTQANLRLGKARGTAQSAGPW